MAATLFISFEISLLPEGVKLYQWTTCGDGNRCVKDIDVFKKYICDKYQSTYVIKYLLNHTNNIIYKSIWYKNGLFYAEVAFPKIRNECINDDTIEALLVPLNRNHFIINDKIYSLHVNLCNYQDNDSEELSSLSGSTYDEDDDIDIDFYNTTQHSVLEIFLDDNDIDDCCDKQCYNLYLWLSQLLSYVFPNSNKTVNNKYNKNA